MDQCNIHTNIEITDYLKKNKIKILLVPSGFSRLIQPLNVSINKLLKDYLDNKLSKSSMNKANDPNIKPPSYKNIILWGLYSLNRITAPMIEYSFKVH